MVTDVFKVIIKMNTAAAVTATIIILIKFVLCRFHFPRRYLFLLWIPIAVRLILPIVPQSPFGVYNSPAEPRINFEFIGTDSQIGLKNVTDSIAAGGKNEFLKDIGNSRRSVSNEEILSYIWAAGVGLMLIYGILSYIRLKNKLRFAMKKEENIYYTDKTNSSFVFGITAPKIYIPYKLSKSDEQSIILHEKMHIKRLDHIFKPFACILLAINWFNPINWISFFIFSSDMEYACDELAVLTLSDDKRKIYLESILSQASVSRPKSIVYTICSFSGAAKKRIKAIINFKDMHTALKIISIAVCLTLVLILCTDSPSHALKNNKTHVAEKGTNFSYAGNKQNTKNDFSLNEQNITSCESANTITSKETLLARKSTEKPETYTQKNTGAETKTDISDPNEDSKNSDTDIRTNKYKINEDQNGNYCFDVFTVISENNEKPKISDIVDELKNAGIVKSEEKNANLKNSYIVDKFSYKNNCRNTNNNVSSDASGNISMFFDMNSDYYVNVTFKDSETKEVVTEYGVLANKTNIYSFMGFDKEKTYDIELQGITNNEWKVEGDYIIY